jgi:DNA-binding beta-propeller fold protein YncE
MKKRIGLALATAALCVSAAAGASELTEKALDVPGFADFLAIDGETVWTTNEGRVEQWSVEGKLASTEVPRPCGTMAVAFGSLWVANCKDGNLYRIDVKTAQVQAIISTGIANPKGETNVVEGAGSIWVPSDGAGKIARIDPASNLVTASIAVEPNTFYLAFGYDALWAVSPDSQSLQKVDPQTDSVTGRLALGKQPGFLAAGEGAVWVQEQGDGTLARVDPNKLQVSGRVKVGETLIYGDIDTGGGAVWLRTTEDQTFAVIDPKSLKILARAGKPSGSGALRYTPEGVWTSAHDLQTLSWWTGAPSAPE